MGFVLKPNEVSVDAKAWHANGGKIMRRIHETVGEDCYRLSYRRFTDLPSELHSVVIEFNSADDAMVYKLVADRQHHAQ